MSAIRLFDADDRELQVLDAGPRAVRFGILDRFLEESIEATFAPIDEVDANVSFANAEAADRKLARND